MSAEMVVSPTGGRSRLFVDERDPHLWQIASAPSVRTAREVVPLRSTLGAGTLPGEHDVVLLPAVEAARLVATSGRRAEVLGPARLVAVLRSDTDPALAALQDAVDDFLVAPCGAPELSVRLRMLDRRAAAPSALEVREVAHELKNVLAALRLTGAVVARLAAPASVGGDAPPRHRDPRVLAGRIDVEVVRAVSLVDELVAVAVAGGHRVDLSDHPDPGMQIAPGEQEPRSCP